MNYASGSDSNQSPTGPSQSSYDAQTQTDTDATCSHTELLKKDGQIDDMTRVKEIPISFDIKNFEVNIGKKIRACLEQFSLVAVVLFVYLFRMRILME